MKNNTQGSIKMISALALFIGLSAQAYAFTPITTTLDFGAKGTNVSNLQSFFAANPSIYPEGLVTGYFGGLTRTAVQRFQTAYGIVSSGSAATTGFGRVGPSTMFKINSLINAGGWTMADTTGPTLYSVVQTKGTNSINLSFTSSENTMARLVYSTNPLMFNEGDMSSNGFGAIGGFSVNSTNGMGATHSITVPNLQSNTTYYYTVIATDAAGNVSVVGPNNSIRTNQ